MKANELRIGNLLQGDALHIPRLKIHGEGITAITAYGIHLLESGYEIGLKPIPITEYWLKKFGFINEGVDHDFVIFKADLTDQYVLMKGSEFAICEVGCLLDMNFSFASFRKIEYVHQLQNIYFALTGNELIIKDNGK